MGSRTSLESEDHKWVLCKQVLWEFVGSRWQATTQEERAKKEGWTPLTKTGDNPMKKLHISPATESPSTQGTRLRAFQRKSKPLEPSKRAPQNIADPLGSLK